VPAVVAVEAEEAMGQDATAKEGAKLLLDEAGSRLVLASRLREKALEVFSYDLVEKSAFGLVALMLHGVGSSRDRVLCDDRSNFNAIPKGTVGRRSRPHRWPMMQIARVIARRSASIGPERRSTDEAEDGC
jgi:hypothetical protein